MADTIEARHDELRIVNKLGDDKTPLLVKARGNGFEVWYNGQFKYYTRD